MTTKYLTFIACAAIFVGGACMHNEAEKDTVSLPPAVEQQPEEEKYIPIKITIEKDLEYDQYTVADTFAYKDIVRFFQWDKISEKLRVIDSIQLERTVWGVLQNKNNVNGEGALVKEWSRNRYNRISDRNGVERHQSIPLYRPDDMDAPELYARDGSLVRIIKIDTTNMATVETINFEGRWSVPKKYLKDMSDTVTFHKLAMVDRTMQTIMAIEKVGDKWLIRSMNPATTGIEDPPYAHKTPLGIFVVQEKKSKMFYTKDGSSELAGYAPWASRFSQGGYIHGVPVNDPNGQPLEYGWTLGTTPRSHMCVRNATSHAKYIYDWTHVFNSLVVVIE